MPLTSKPLRQTLSCGGMVVVAGARRRCAMLLVKVHALTIGSLIEVECPSCETVNEFRWTVDGVLNTTLDTKDSAPQIDTHERRQGNEHPR